MKSKTYHTDYSRKMLRMAEIMKTIAHPTRLQILQLLKSEPELAVSEIQERLDCGCEQSMLSHHLNKMKDKGILQDSKEGKFKFYHLTDDTITQILDCIENSSILMAQ